MIITTFLKHNKSILLIMLIGLVIRLILLPYSQTVHADAVSRVFIAKEWLANPYYIIDGYWGPLHHYLNAFSLWLIKGNILGPKLINILFAVMSVYPLYHFTINIFKTKFGAQIVALIYVLSPIIVRNSLQALAGVSYAFFVILAMYYITEGFKSKRKLKYGILAGIALTLASAIRYEAWVLIALFTGVIFLYRQWSFMFIFLVFAVIFPVSWMIGNQIKFGDFIYSVHQAGVWNIELEGINEHIDSRVIFKRLLFFPISLFIIISPLNFILLYTSIIVSGIKKRISREQLIWLLPFIVLFIIYLYKCYHGTLMMQHRFSISLMFLSLPFISLFFNEKMFNISLKTKKVITIIGVISILPLSLVLDKVPFHKAAFFLDALANGIEETFAETYRETHPLPTLNDKEVPLVTEELNKHLLETDFLILDYFGWDKTYFMALRSKVKPFIVHGAKYGEIDFIYLDNALSTNPSGLIVLHYDGRLQEQIDCKGDIIKINNTDDYLQLHLVYQKNDFRFFRYKTLDKNSQEEPTSIQQGCIL